MTQESEQEQRRRISEMEKDMTTCRPPTYDETVTKFSNAEIQMEDMKLCRHNALVNTYS